jgi:hypothetical protein
MPAANSQNAARIATGGVLLAALLAVAGALQFHGLETAFQDSHRDRFYIAARSSIFEPLLAMLPPGAEIGYITDVESGSTNETYMFLSAQYYLAPRLLLRGDAHDWVIGSFRKPANFAAFAARGLRLERDFGNGLLLFRRSR